MAGAPTQPLTAGNGTALDTANATLANVTGVPAATMASECCTLWLPRATVPGESLASLFVPLLSIARLVARNTGVQGGFGHGDSLELTFHAHTDRAVRPTEPSSEGRATVTSPHSEPSTSPDEPSRRSDWYRDAPR